MKTVWKYPIPITDVFYLTLPKGAVILHAGTQPGDADTEAQVWVLVDPDQELTVRHWCHVYGTGRTIRNPGAVRWVATLQKPPFVWHLFEEVTNDA